MPRQTRIVLPGLPHHITQRGNGRVDVFDSDSDRRLFLDLLSRYARQYDLAIWGYCLMSNHFHLIAVPAHADSMASVIGRLESDYARYLNVCRRTSGHLWQARYHSVAMDASHSWRALAYVERNPVRAGLAPAAVKYQWSSAAARMGLTAAPAWLDLNPWHREWTGPQWLSMLHDSSADEKLKSEIREATLSGHPLGDLLLQRAQEQLGRTLRRGRMGRPPKITPTSGEVSSAQAGTG